jgi:hypothetical protein
MGLNVGRIMKMVEGYTLSQAQAELVKNYGFDPVCDMNNTQFIEDQHRLGYRNWSFTEYFPQRVAHLFHNWNKCFPDFKVPPGVKQAYEQGLSLLEVCAGSYDNPRYFPITANLDIELLKKQWCLDYYFCYRVVTGKEPGKAYVNHSASVYASKGEASR